jgi:ribonuclease D
MENNGYAETITEEEIGRFELSWFRGEIVLVEDMETFNDTFPRLKGSSVLGFDTETRPSFKKGKKNKVSLIQLANEELACLVRINKIGIPPQLAAILADERVIKAGVAVHDDIRFLNSVR